MRALEKCDYTTLWEEHILYFTLESFRRCFAFSGFSLVRYELCPYPFENSLVGIAQLREGVASFFPSESTLENEKSRAQTYSEKLPRHRDKLKKFFSEYRQSQDKIALFGGGHLACTFINLLELKDHIEFIVDDNPNKQGLFMPGSRLLIYRSAALLEENIKFCLLSLSLESEDKVVQNNQDFLEGGGTFFSIFPVSNHALQI